MDIRNMRYVLAVMQTDSFTQAAHQLFLSPQALGKAIRSVEDELGAPLFVRGGRTLVPTAFGRAFAREAAACVDTFDKACNRIGNLARQAHGSVCIACAYGVPNALGYGSPDVLRQMLKSHTGLEYDIAFDELPDLLAERELDESVCDLGLLMGLPEHVENYESVLLRRHRLVAVLAAGHPLAERATLSVRDLAQWPVASRNRYYRSFHVLENCARCLQITLNYAICSPDETLWRQKVLEGAVGIGVSFLQGNVDSCFVTRPFDEKDMAFSIYLVRRRDDTVSEAVAALWNTIASQAAP